MKKINRVVGEAKVSMRERIGKKESLSEVPDYLINTRTLSEIKQSSKEILSKISKQSKLNQSLIEDNAALGEDMIDFGNFFLGEEGYSCMPLGNGLRTLGDLYIQMEVCRSKLDIAVSSRFVVPKQEFLKNELKDAYLAKSRYDKFRISFDAASEQFKNARKKSSTTPEKLQEVETNLNQVTQEFSSVANESIYQMEDIIDKFNADTFDRVYDSVKIYQEYFQRGLEVINNILPDMEQHKNSMSKVKQLTAEKRKKRDLQPVQFETRSMPPPPSSLSSSTGVSNRPNSSNLSPSSNINNNKVFGIPLTVLSDREGRAIPLVMEKTIEYLANKSLSTEGVFRVSPNQKYLNELKANITACGGVGNAAQFIEQCDDVHIISAFLKSFLREMPIPLLTFELYKPMVKSVMDVVDVNKSCNTITELLLTLPPSHLALTKSLIDLAYKIAKQSQLNKMTSSNLAVVLAPNILYPKQLDIQAINDSNTTIQFLISNYPLIFDKINIPSSSSSNRNSGGNSNTNNTPIVSKDPPRLPTRPQTILFKSSPVILTPNSSSQITSAPTTPKLSLPPTPASPPSKRLSSSGSVLPSPSNYSSNSNGNGSSSSPIQSSSSPNQLKPINNRVSVYLQNFPSTPPSLPPKPSPSALSKSSSLPPLPNSNQSSLNNSGGYPKSSSPLPPLPTSNTNSNGSSNRSRPTGILISPGSTVSSNDGSKLTFNLLDDSVNIQSNDHRHYDNESEDNLIEW